MGAVSTRRLILLGGVGSGRSALFESDVLFVTPPVSDPAVASGDDAAAVEGESPTDKKRSSLSTSACSRLDTGARSEATKAA